MYNPQVQKQARIEAEVSQEYWQAHGDLLRLWQANGDIIPARERLRAARRAYDEIVLKIVTRSVPEITPDPPKDESKGNVPRAATHRFKDKDFCVFCEQLRDVTSDHVPPDCFFPDQSGLNLLTVPACEECNRSWAEYGEYARVVFLSLGIKGGNASALALKDKAIRSIEINANSTTHPLAQMRQTMQPSTAVDEEKWTLFCEPTGAPNIAIYQVDTHSLGIFFGKLVRALFFRETGKRLHGDWAVTYDPVSAGVPGVPTAPHHQNRMTGAQRLLTNIFSCGRRDKIGDVFDYAAFLPDADPRSSFWAFSFYESFMAVAATQHRSACKTSAY